LEIIPALGMIVVELTVIPLGTKSPSVSKYVAKAVEELRKAGLKPELIAMGTIFEAKDARAAFKAVERAHNAVFKAGAKRVVTSIRIDERRDKKSGMQKKVNSVKERL